jgi:hypothetical protein
LKRTRYFNKESSRSVSLTSTGFVLFVPFFPHLSDTQAKSPASSPSRLRNQSHRLVQKSHARRRPTWVGGRLKSRRSRTTETDRCMYDKAFLHSTRVDHCRTFLKRKGGLFKKAHELSVLCSVDVAVIIFGHNKKLYEFSSGDIGETLTRYSYVCFIRSGRDVPSS